MPPGRLAAALEVLVVATRLGLTSFGGPVAHLRYFRSEYVLRRRWLDEQTYADVMAHCQFPPGLARSQVGITIGIFRAELLGGLAAWLGFTLPSATLLVLFAHGIRGLARSPSSPSACSRRPGSRWPSRRRRPGRRSRCCAEGAAGLRSVLEHRHGEEGARIVHRDQVVDGELERFTGAEV
jgi:hypothetical protein